jgi:hypothetical protein
LEYRKTNEKLYFYTQFNIKKKIENGKKFDLVQFEQMMVMISKVRRKEVTEESASQQFGEQMVEKYVKPKLD